MRCRSGERVPAGPSSSLSEQVSFWRPAHSMMFVSQAQVMLKVSQNRLTQMAEEQAGFRTGKSTTEQILKSLTKKLSSTQKAGSKTNPHFIEFLNQTLYRQTSSQESHLYTFDACNKGFAMFKSDDHNFLQTNHLSIYSNEMFEIIHTEISLRYTLAATP